MPPSRCKLISNGFGSCWLKHRGIGILPIIGRRPMRTVLRAGIVSIELRSIIARKPMPPAVIAAL
jgi:hypothetical protein